MKKSYWILRFALIGLFVSGTIGHAIADINITQIHLLFEPPYYKHNRWIPLQLRLENDEEEFSGEIELRIKNVFAGITQKYSRPLTLPRKSLRNLHFYVLPRGITSKFEIHLIDTEGIEVVKKEFTPEAPKRSQDFLILALTPNIDNLVNLTGRNLEDRRDSSLSQRTIYVTYLGGMNLPDIWKGYDSIDLVIIRDISLASHNISRQQKKALIEWIYSGGSLLISGGRNIQYLSDSFLEPLLPVASMRLRTETNLPILTQLFGLDFESQHRFELIDSKLRNGSRSLVATEEGTPIIAEREIGDGKVIFLAFDYSDPTFSPSLGGIRDESHLWDWLLNDVAPSKLKMESLFDPYRRHELRIERLLSSLGQSHSPLLKFLSIFLSAYAIGFGVFIYIVTKRTKTAKLIWLGGLCVIFIFTVFPISLNYVKKGELTANGLSIVNIYPEYPRAKIETYLGLLASDNSKFNLQSDAKLFMRRLDDASNALYDFVQTEDFQYNGIKLNPWTVQTFYVESYLELNGTIKSDLQQVDGIVKGTIRNNLPFDLSDSYITYGRFYDKIGAFNRGAEVSIEVDKRHPGEATKAIFEAAANARAVKRRIFARILGDEGILRYLAQPAKPKIIGWTQSSILQFNLDRSYNMENEVLVIIHI